MANALLHPHKWPTVRIKVEGPSGSGKTIISALIKDYLNGLGYEAQAKAIEGIDGLPRPSDWKKRLHKGQRVTIVEKVIKKIK